MEFILTLIFIIGVSRLWRMGGSDEYPLLWRRVGVPLAILCYGLIYCQLIPLLLGAIAVGFGAWLPITLFGSDFVKNTPWYPFLSSLYALGVVAVDFPNKDVMTLITAVLMVILYTIYLPVADLYRKKTGKDVWYVQEYLSGATLATLIAINIHF